MKNPSAVVRAIMCGVGTHRRFTQDSPVFPEVWAFFLENGPNAPAKLLIEPWWETPPFEVAGQMRAQMRDAKFKGTSTVYNRTMLASELTLSDLVHDVIPLTGWYVNALEPAGRQRKPAKGRAPARMAAPRAPSRSEMWEDIVRPPKPTYPNPQFLGFVRIIAIIAYLHLVKGSKEEKEARLVALLTDLGSRERKKAEAAREELVEMIVIGATQGMKMRTLPRPAAQGVIFSIHRNRPATLALKYSVKTVKADAAVQLFGIECKQLTWAIMDCGIDARHPAFMDRAKVGEEDPTSEAQRLKSTRIKETYDFSALHDLLLGKSKNLPKHYRQGKGTDDEKLQEIEKRINRSQDIDWELLRPFLQVPHEPGKYKVPTDSHGTHVAGIVGADWPRDGDPVRGMCPDIRLIDLRVCKDDGSSEEFIIISALQFLRHLNSSADKPYVLGVNMSLSIPNDPTAFACGRTLVCTEAGRTVSSGVVVVAAAGNLGYRRMPDEHAELIEQFCPVSITDPGNAEAVITVGSTHRIEPHNYGVSYFSSRGPTGDGRNKPDILAPGEKIVAPALDDRLLRSMAPAWPRRTSAERPRCSWLGTSN